MIELTQEQHQAIVSGTEPVRAIDPATRAEYVLLRAEVYERIRNLVSDDPGWLDGAYRASMEAFREGWDDPRMDVYDAMDPRRQP